MLCLNVFIHVLKQKNDTMPSEKIHFPNARKLRSQIYVNDERHLEEVETALDVCIVCRDNWVQISGSPQNRR